jgi:hypothetical protein
MTIWANLRIADIDLMAMTGGGYSDPQLWVLAADGVRASVDLNFISNRAWSSGTEDTPANKITVTRGSIAYMDDSSGNWTSVGNNTLRQSNKGALVEEARTNGIRNNSMQGGGPGTQPTYWTNAVSGGLNYAVVGVGTINGMDYLDYRVTGTSTGGQCQVFPEQNTLIIAATPGQVWTFSMFVALIAGAIPPSAGGGPNFAISEYDSGGAFLRSNIGSVFGASLTSDLQRFSQTITTGASVAGIVGRINVSAQPGAEVDCTIRLGWPQMELGAFATSPIRTTNAAVARAAEIVKVNSPPALSGGATLFGQGYTKSNAAVNCVLSSYDATSAERFLVYNSSFQPVALAVTASSPTFSGAFAAGSWPIDQRGKIALGYAPGSSAASFNNLAPITGSSASALPVVNNFVVGAQLSASSYFNGYVERVALWPTTRISNLGLQQLTAI